MNPWRKHAGLWFGRMHEDWAIEAAFIPRASRVFCIASAGDTAIELAALGHQVEAVDINPAQVAYVQARLTGQPPRAGRVDRLLACVRNVATPAVGRDNVERFLNMTDPPEQVAFFDAHLDVGLVRRGLTWLTHPMLLRGIYQRPMIASLPPRFGDALRDRFRRALGRHPNRYNPWAWRLFAGCEPPGYPRPVDPHRLRYRPRVICTDAADYLASCPAGHFHGLSLSNILDGATPNDAARLIHAAQYAAAPGAWLVLRSFAEPHNDDEARWAERDRSMFWGRIVVEQLNKPAPERSDDHVLSTQTPPADHRRASRARAGADLRPARRRARPATAAWFNP
jgi:S-adenosylmethionine:diacylglycerol 3-amino-3-carboxypropyl transferase